MIRWTKAPYRRFYGRYFLESQIIEINSVLNSKNVDKEVIKFLIYHEMLHRDYDRHDDLFRQEEHRYPNYVEYDHFLDGTMNQFDISEW